MKTFQVVSSWLGSGLLNNAMKFVPFALCHLYANALDVGSPNSLKTYRYTRNPSNDFPASSPFAPSHLLPDALEVTKSVNDLV